MKGKILLLLFALPFTAVGVWAGYSVTTTLFDGWRMQDWAQTEGALVSGGYSTHVGEDSTTYEAYASYTYSAAGVNYTGTRVGIADGADNIGSYQEDLGRSLQRALDEGREVPVYYDPEAPHDAVLDPTIRWGLIGFKSIFLLLFGGVGVGVLIYALRARPAKDAADPAFAETPWLLNDAWQSAEIRSDSRLSMWVAWGFAAFWNLISLPLPFLIVDEIVDKGNTMAAVGLLFPLIGIGLLVWAIARSREWRRFGSVPVTLDPFPGAIGGHVGGTLDLALPFDSAACFNVTLTSLHRYVSGSGKNRRQRETALWQESQSVGMRPGPRGTRLIFRFDVPAGLKESAAVPDNRSSHAWRLHVEADLEGVDFDRNYELPVYPTGRLSVALPEDALREISTLRADSQAADVKQRLNLSYSASGAKQVYFPAGRNLGAAVSGVVIGLIFLAAGAFLLMRQNEGFIGSIFAGMGALVALAMAYVGVNSLSVSRLGGDIVAVRRILGLAVRRKTMRAHEVVRATSKSTFQTQSGGKHTMHYSLYLHDQSGGKMTVGEGFRSQAEATAALQLLCTEFGVAPAAMTNDVATGDQVDVLAADS